jgi:hypothetical protein
MTAPILFLIFNRPETTARVIKEIRAAQPPRLYIAADGPRDRNRDSERCEAVRRIAMGAVDWPCEVRTLFRSRNLGCGRAVSGALDWFFEQEPEGIILEDDCIPSQSFFPYCTELLARYRDDARIMCISGNNLQHGRVVTPFSYYFSRYNHCWGWASWRRAWQLYDFTMASWAHCRKNQILASWSDGDPSFVKYWTEIFDRMARGEKDTWDYQWTFACWNQHGLTCLPVRNLVTNVGFGPDATHTKDEGAEAARLPSEEMSFPLSHPPLIFRTIEADRFTQINHFDLQKNNTTRPGIRELIKRIPFAVTLVTKLRRSRASVVKMARKNYRVTAEDPP